MPPGVVTSAKHPEIFTLPNPGDSLVP
jgi:hypothetical protein